MEASKKRHALITGSTGGIGSAVAAYLSELGYRLVLVDVDAPRLARQAELFPGCATHVLDLADRDAVAAFCERVGHEAWELDVAFVNAGMIAVGEVVDLPTEKLHLQLQVNLVASAALIQAFARRMVKQRRGHLLATVSIGGIVSLKGSAVYSASKFGLRGLLWGLRDELAPAGVHVSGIYPAGVDTPMLRHEARNGGSPLNFLSTPVTAADVARAVIRTIERPRLETYVPASEGFTSRLIAAFPGALSRLYPWLQKLGERGRRTYLARIGRA